MTDEGYARGGKTASFEAQPDLRFVRDAAPAEVYRTIRRQDHSYEIAGLPKGRYRVRLHFMDESRSRKRAMNFRLNGKSVLTGMNIFRRAGSENRAQIEEFPCEVKRGEPLVIECDQGTGNDVLISGIEILTARPDQSPGPPDPEDLATAQAIRDLTGGAPARLVWLQSDKGHVYTGEKNTVHLVGLDTGDGIGERRIYSEARSFSKPLITPDGERVVVSDRETGLIWLVSWADGTVTGLGAGFHSDVWRDPESGIDWVYLRKGDGTPGDPIVRRRLDDPSVEEPVWDRTDNGQEGVPWFQLSADGRRFSDAFPWPKCGVGDPAGRTWQKTAQGCWPGMAPDNSYRSFVFSGDHNQLSFFEADASESRTIPLTDLPGRPGEKVYFPRWSNDVRFLTVSCPEFDPSADLYLGKFDSKFEKIERWVRVTHNLRSDIFGDAWIRPGEAPPEEAVMNAPDATSASAASTVPAWPPTERGVVWLWKNSRARNEAPPRGDEARPFPCRGELRGRARFGRHFDMLPDGGYFEAAGDAGARIVRACRESGRFSLEALVTPMSVEAAGGDPLPILSFVDDRGAPVNFSLCQAGDVLALALPGLKSKPVPLFHIEGDARPVHVLVTAGPDGWLAYCDGVRAPLAAGLAAGPGQWTEAALRAGGFAGGTSWAGRLEAIAWYDRELDAGEAALHAAAARARLDGRSAVPRVAVRARLVEITKSPAPADIAPYRRALVENVYEAGEVVSGALPDGTKRIVVRQWSILDGKLLEPATRREVGREVVLALEPVSDHPELEGEYRSGDHAEFDAPVFYDVESHR